MPGKSGIASTVTQSWGRAVLCISRPPGRPVELATLRRGVCVDGASPQALPQRAPQHFPSDLGPWPRLPGFPVGLGGALQAAEVRRREEPPHVDQREHEQSSEQGTQLHRRPTPQEGAAAMVSQDHAQHHLDIAQTANEKHPRDHLQGQGRRDAELWGLWGNPKRPKV